MADTDPELTDGFDFKLLIHEHELEHIAGWVLADSHRETGGDLCGFWTHSGSPAVQFVLGPGPRARHEIAAFYQDDDYMRTAMRLVQDKHGLQQIGEWHSHHRLGLAVPSGGDVRTLQRMFDHHPLQQFVLCIASVRPSRARALVDGSSRDEVEIGAFLFERGREGYRRGLWVVLPGESPIATSVRTSREIRGSRRSRSWVVRQTTLDHSFSAPKPPPEGWYTKPAAAQFLRSFDALCRELYGACRISLHDGILCYGPEKAERAWELRFPRSFPFGRVELDVADMQRSSRRPGFELQADAARDVDAVFGGGAERLFDWLKAQLSFEQRGQRTLFLERFHRLAARRFSGVLRDRDAGNRFQFDAEDQTWQITFPDPFPYRDGVVRRVADGMTETLALPAPADAQEVLDRVVAHVAKSRNGTGTLPSLNPGQTP